MINKLKKYCKILADINWWQTWSLFRRVIKPRSSSIRVLNRSNIKIAPSARIELAECASFEINRQDYIKTHERSTLYLGENAHFKLKGRFTMHGHSFIMIYKDAVLEIGDNTYLNGGRIDCSYNIRIGSNCAIADGVRIIDNSWHTIDAEKRQLIEIEDNVWVAGGAMILPGIKIGKGAIVASGAVVTKDVPAKCMVAGVPAMVVKENVEWRH